MSLGSDCSVALYLRDEGLRKQAYPLDWCVTPMRAVINMFETDFRYILKEQNLMFLDSVHRKAINDENVEGELTNDIVTPVYCKQYNMLLPHDFSKKGRADLEFVKEKYNRRIEKLLLQLNEKGNKFTFIANNAPTAPNSWRAAQYRLVSGDTYINDFVGWKERMAVVLDKKYPELQYKLHDLKEFKQL